MSDHKERLLERSVYPEDRDTLQRIRCRKGKHAWTNWEEEPKPNAGLLDIHNWPPIWERRFCRASNCRGEIQLRPLPRHPKIYRQIAGHVVNLTPDVIYHSTPPSEPGFFASGMLHRFPQDPE